MSPAIWKRQLPREKSQTKLLQKNKKSVGKITAKKSIKYQQKDAKKFETKWAKSSWKTKKKTTTIDAKNCQNCYEKIEQNTTVKNRKISSQNCCRKKPQKLLTKATKSGFENCLKSMEIR